MAFGAVQLAMVAYGFQQPALSKTIFCEPCPHVLAYSAHVYLLQAASAATGDVEAAFVSRSALALSFNGSPSHRPSPRGYLTTRVCLR
jgi:hypothetical protein